MPTKFSDCDGEVVIGALNVPIPQECDTRRRIKYAERPPHYCAALLVARQVCYLQACCEHTENVLLEDESPQKPSQDRISKAPLILVTNRKLKWFDSVKD